VTYTYDSDGNRSSTQYPAPENYTFNYTYTNRNQLKTVNNYVTYVYDENGYTGDLTTRSLGVRLGSSYAYDNLDRVTHIGHSFAPFPTTRTLDYGYDSVGNRLWTQRDGGSGDVFRYDLNDQVNGVWLNVINPTATPPPRPNITYDANGNRSTFVGDSYATNNLNQYTTRNNVSAGYDASGNMTASPDTGAAQLICTYDAQNRLLTASKGQTTMSFAYDGLNRQVKRSVTGQPDTFSVWDGWELIEEYQPGSASATAAYVYGGSDLIAGTYNGQVYYYYHDASGSTSHLADSTGHLVEWYRYDLQGTPSFYDQDNNQRNPNQTAYGVRHLFTGQQWYQELGLYDLRNRFYSPDLGRFLQPDPIGFDGDTTNLYRYCGNNPVTSADPMGLEVPWPGYPGPFDGSVDFTPSTDKLSLVGLTFGLGSPWLFWVGGAISLLDAVTWDVIVFYGVVYSQPHSLNQMTPPDEPPPGGTRQNPPPPRGPPPVESDLITISEGKGDLPPSFYSMSGLPLMGTPLADIGNYFENFGATIHAQVLPGGAVVTFSWGNEPGGNVGAGELINAWTEGGKKPADL
jgi:RHS repeat-associated protein